MRDICDIFRECENMLNRESLRDRIKEEKRIAKEEKEENKKYYLDIVDGSLESEFC
jgi:hypothetical protein